jgi:hypothetical protein
MRTQKHRIVSDNFASFERNLRFLKEQLGATGQRILWVRLRLKTYNNDYSGYTPRYVAVLKTKKEEVKS